MGGGRKMSLETVREEIRSGFRLDEQVSLTGLRRSEWRKKLATKGKLRVSDRDQVVGVLISPELWEGLTDLEQYLEELEDRIEQLEIERLWGHRVHHERQPGRIVAKRILEKLLKEE